MALQSSYTTVHRSARSKAGFVGVVETHLVSRPQILRRPEQISLHETLEEVEPEAKGTVVETCDGAMEGVLKGGDDEA